VIGRLSGVLLEKNPPQILVDVHGLAYEVDVPMSTFYNLPQVGGEVTLHTHLVVREDAHLLYGFGSEGERGAFRQLLKISGIGARTALAVLSGLSVTDLQDAVSRQDSGRLVKIPGIGKKTAERLLLELRDKLDIHVRVARADGASAQAAGTDVSSALIALGYSEKEAAWAVKQVDSTAALSDAIRQCLKLLSKA
jgi:Holliday junction DNA helicase RuvA